ncbi:hypothetical protein G7Y79_00028g062180 [Physcia stellaris]|nr:hypothetical protein G7Y79_00028g062180 [Physcia stellaris]
MTPLMKIACGFGYWGVKLNINDTIEYAFWLYQKGASLFRPHRATLHPENSSARNNVPPFEPLAIHFVAAALETLVVRAAEQYVSYDAENIKQYHSLLGTVDAEEAEEIRDEDREGIEFLESLLPKFEGSLGDRDIKAWFQEYWEPQMEEILATRDRVPLDEAGLKEAGVMLFSSRISPSDTRIATFYRIEKLHSTLAALLEAQSQFEIFYHLARTIHEAQDTRFGD